MRSNRKGSYNIEGVKTLYAENIPNIESGVSSGVACKMTAEIHPPSFIIRRIHVTCESPLGST
jgi:hypothetical protein